MVVGTWHVVGPGPDPLCPAIRFAEFKPVIISDWIAFGLGVSTVLEVAELCCGVLDYVGRG